MAIKRKIKIKIIMIGPSPYNGGLVLKLVMLHAIKPAELLRLTVVCKNWLSELRKDEYWYRFRAAITATLPTLNPLFATTMPLWRVFSKRIWPVAVNLQRSAFQIYKLNHHILASIVISFKPENEQVVQVQTQEPVYFHPNMFGGVIVNFTSKNTMTVLFTSITTDDSLVKRLGIKRMKYTKKAQSPPYLVARVCLKNGLGQIFRQYDMPVKEFFLPFLKIVLPKN